MDGTTRQAAILLQSVATRLLRLARSAPGKHGLGSAQYSALAVLRERGPLPVVELARLERVSHPTMSRVVAGLVKIGVVHKVADRADGRSRLIELTREGTELYDRVCANRVAVIEAILGELRGETVDELVTVVSRVAASLEAPARAD